MTQSNYEHNREYPEEFRQDPTERMIDDFLADIYEAKEDEEPREDPTERRIDEFLERRYTD